LADPSDFWFWVLILGVAIAGGGWLAFRSLNIARLIEDTPTSRIRSAAQGYVEVAGRCRALDGTQNLSPLTRRPCVWWRYRIQQKSESGPSGKQRQSWTTINSGRSEQPFLLDDGTGQCIVQPGGAEILAGESTTWYGSTPWPTQPPGAGLLRSQQHRYRYFEERIYEHEQLCVLGQFSSHTSAGQRDMQAEVAALLAQWKQDQAQLAERFDSDRDGHVSVGEWEQAREEARRTVATQQLERPSQPALHVLSRPGAGQLFLIAAFPEGDIAKRYRRRAIAAFIGFFGDLRARLVAAGSVRLSPGLSLE
jgi:hypothetical protein